MQQEDPPRVNIDSLVSELKRRPHGGSTSVPVYFVFLTKQEEGTYSVCGFLTFPLLNFYKVWMQMLISPLLPLQTSL